jgi:hypothetical protein
VEKELMNSKIKYNKKVNNMPREETTSLPKTQKTGIHAS